MPELSEQDEVIYVPIASVTKVEKGPEGSLYVYGKGTGGEIDLDEQIVDPDFARKAVQEWFESWGNIRQMHSGSLPPAGKAVEMEPKEDGSIWLKTKVVEPTAQKLVEEGVYQAYSIGIARPRIVRDIKARHGRVVDGRVVEFSLVDNPALPSAKFTIAKRATPESDIEEVEEFVGKSVDASEGKCGLCGGSGKIMAGHRTCPDCGGSGKLSDVSDEAKAGQRRRGELRGEETAEKSSEVEVAKRDVDPDVGGGVDRDKIPAEDFAGEHRSFPIVTPGDVSDAASSLGRAKGQDTDEIKRRIIEIAHRKGPKFVAELPEAWKTDKEQSVSKSEDVAAESAAEITKRIHDAVCEAYAWEDVTAVYPDLAKNGLAHGLADPTRRMVFQMLQNEIAEDNGSGINAWDIAHLGKTYGLLWQFLNTEGLESINGVDYHPTFGSDDLGPLSPLGKAAAEAREELHKAFEDAYPGTHASPKDPPPATRFRRGYLRAGRARENASSTSKHLPRPGGGLEASDYRRPLITAGHEADAPANKAAEAIVEALAKTLGVEVEEARAAVAPLLAKGDTKPAGGSSTRTFYTNAAKEQQRNAMQALHDHIARTFPDICPLDVDNEGGSDEVPDTKADAAWREPRLPEEASAPGEVRKGEGSEDVEVLIKTAVAQATKGYQETIEDLQRRVDGLGRQPDLTKAPVRGVGQVIPDAKTLQKRAPAPEAADPYASFARQVLMQSSNPELVEMARTVLRTPED